MKRTVLLTVLTAICMTACTRNEGRAQTEPDIAKSKTLVAYFSATGTTKAAAERIAANTGGELYAIEPREAYTAADLDWTDRQSRSSTEMNDPASRPALKAVNDDMARYDTVYIGYPIWWGVAPRVINTFIEAHDLTGKTVIPFATSGGSSVGPSVEALRTAYPELNIKDGTLER